MLGAKKILLQKRLRGILDLFKEFKLTFGCQTFHCIFGEEAELFFGVPATTVFDTLIFQQIWRPAFISLHFFDRAETVFSWFFADARKSFGALDKGSTLVNFMISYFTPEIF